MYDHQTFYFTGQQDNQVNMYYNRLIFNLTQIFNNLIRLLLPVSDAVLSEKLLKEDTILHQRDHYPDSYRYKNFFFSFEGHVQCYEENKIIIRSLYESVIRNVWMNYNFGVRESKRREYTGIHLFYFRSFFLLCSLSGTIAIIIIIGGMRLNRF